MHVPVYAPRSVTIATSFNKDCDVIAIVSTIKRTIGISSF